MSEKGVVYVVDDEPEVLKSLCAVLRARGFQARGFSGAEALLDEADLDSVGCVVSDLRMPGLDGIQLQAQIRSAGSTLAVVVATGHADATIVEKLVAGGSVAVLEKPYDLDAMEEAILKALAVSRASFSTGLPIGI